MRAFGPSALVTPANGVTMARVAITPVLLAAVAGSGASYLVLALWIALASSDGLDGYLARRHGTTRSGAFLDPLADKLLVLGAMVALAGRGVFAWFPVSLIAFREVAMSIYRSWVGRRGVSIPARRSAKAKTVVQEVSVGLALFPPVARRAPGLARIALWVAVVLTLSTGVQYLLDGAAARRDRAGGADDKDASAR
ncbi:MAG TPA: CDP-alcohol phosphatidyltransferase family protein [Acidimicrobiales bacterium]|nr:CDP-alcohol phosphatidyltransferase family protein [Acidimicrobiales bacterium]